jgi:hypothetical protein
MKKKCVPYILLLVLVQPSNGQIRVLQGPRNFVGQGVSQILAEKKQNLSIKCPSKVTTTSNMKISFYGTKLSGITQPRILL